MLDADMSRLTDADNRMRRSAPGMAGWEASPAEMAAMLNDDELDPECYLLARNRRTDDYDGIIRVWMATPTPKIGFIGVVESQRRTRLAAMMIEAIAERLRTRGVDQVIARTDVENWTSHTMARRHGGAPGATMVEYVRSRIATDTAHR